MPLEFVFWLSIGLILYTYAGYILILKVVSVIFRKQVKRQNITPAITVLISCYNEEAVLDSKLINTLALDYPKDRMEVIVISDASSDNTDNIAGRYSEKGIKLRRLEGRIGKTACINKIVPEATGEIIIFSDANSHYHKSALVHMMKNFADDKIGCVTGFTKYTSVEEGIEVESIGLYSRLEKMTKVLESRIGSCIGADGAIFAIRKELYEPLRDVDINDFVIPLTIVSKGYRVVIDEDVFCNEESAHDLQGEFNRQVRITNRTIRALWNNRHLFNGMRYHFFSVQLISHKVFKFLTPLFLILTVLSSVALSGHHMIYTVALLLQIGIYIFISLPESTIRGMLMKRVHSFSRTFFAVNLAMAKGWITFLQGKDFVTWKSSR